MGFFKATGTLDEEQTDAILREDSVHLIYKRIQITSIQLPREELSTRTQLAYYLVVLYPSQEKVVPRVNPAHYYVGVMLDLKDQVKLLETFATPPDWFPEATHMTISFEPLPRSSIVQLGDRVPLTVIAVGKSPQAFAVQVKVRLHVYNI